MWFEISHFCWLALSSADKLRPVTLSCKCHLVNHLFNWIREILGRKHLAKCQTTCTGNITDNLQVPSKKKQRLSLLYKHPGNHSFMGKKKKITILSVFLSNLGCSFWERICLKCGTSHRKWGHPWGRSGVGEHLVLLRKQALFLGWDHSQSIKHTQPLHYQPTLHKLKHEEYIKISHSKMSDFLTKKHFLVNL